MNTGNPRPVISIPLTGPGLGGGGIGEGSFLRNSIAWHMNKSNVLIESAVDIPRFTKDGLLIEGIGENVCLRSRELDNAAWDVVNSVGVNKNSVGVDGVGNSAYTLTDTAGNYQSLTQSVAIPNDGNKHTLSLFIKKDNDTTRFPEFQIRLADGTERDHFVQVNTKTGAITSRVKHTVTDTVTIQSYGDWWYLSLSCTNNTSGNTTLLARLYPALSNSFGGSAGFTGSVIVDQVQVELNQSYPSSPIITEGAAVTRATEAGQANVSGAQWDINTTLTNLLEETLGAEIATGTLTAATLYKITADEGDHFYTGSDVDEYFTAVGDETADASNKVKEVLNDSRGTMVVDVGHPAVASADYALAGDLISVRNAAQGFLSNQSNGRFRLDDSSGDVTVSATYVVGDVNRVAVRWGIDSSNVREMDVTYHKADGTWVVGSADDYAGSFLMNDYLLTGVEIDYPHTFKNFKFFDRVLTDDELEKL
jgi:hypothetical protein